MTSIFQRLAVVLTVAAVSLPALAADRDSGCKAQDDLAWPIPGNCAPGLVVLSHGGAPQPDTTQPVIAGLSPAVTLSPFQADGEILPLAPAAPQAHFGVVGKTPSARLAVR